jgi:prephenate dehydrogenase
MGMARLVGADPVTVGAAAHDRAVALISHGPHVVAAAMAARLQAAPDVALGLAGPGVRDVTRVAASDPGLWLGILRANAIPVAEVLEGVATDLTTVAAALRDGAAEGTTVAADGATVAAEGAVAELLGRGRSGRRRLPGKHGGPDPAYAHVSVLLPDRPGELAMVFQAAGVAGVNIEDVSIEHSPGRPVGVLELSVRPEAAERLAKELRARGWSVPQHVGPEDPGE